jgi:hypothetical protein
MVCVRYPPAQWACRVPALGPCWGQELYLEEARGCHYWHCLALPQRLRWDGGAEVSHKTVSKRPNAALGFIPAAPLSFQACTETAIPLSVPHTNALKRGRFFCRLGSREPPQIEVDPQDGLCSVFYRIVLKASGRPSLFLRSKQSHCNSTEPLRKPPLSPA